MPAVNVTMRQYLLELLANPALANAETPLPPVLTCKAHQKVLNINLKNSGTVCRLVCGPTVELWMGNITVASWYSGTRQGKR